MIEVLAGFFLMDAAIRKLSPANNKRDMALRDKKAWESLLVASIFIFISATFRLF